MTAVQTGAAAGTITWQRDVPHTPVATAVSCGGIVAVAGAEGGCWLLAADSGAVLAELALPGGALSVAFSPDGELLAVTGPAGYLVARVAGGAVLHDVRAGWCSRAAWTGQPGQPGQRERTGRSAQSGSRLAVATGREVTVLDTSGVTEAGFPLLRRATGLPSTVTDVAWLRGGRTLLACAYGGVYSFSGYGSRPSATYGYPGSHLALAVPSTERWICTGNQDRSVHVWRVRDREELEMDGYPSKISRLTFDDTGRWLAVDGAPDVTVWDFDGRGPAGRSPRQLSCHEQLAALAWQPGGAAVLASYGSEGVLAIWHPAPGRPGRRQQPVATRELGPDDAELCWLGAGSLLVADRSGVVTRIDEV